ncbi:MAG: DUF4339 domain-containing protein [Thermoleophilia bacterium]|nr:DUF4339 domain-containing protein [Thermoleophilia bacterium]
MTAGSTASGWYYLKAGAPAGQQMGPLTWQALVSAAQSGALTPADPVWHSTLPQWVPAGQVQGIFAPSVPAVQTPAAGRQPISHPPAAYPARVKHAWLAWAMPLAALILVGAGLGIYFGAFYGQDEGGDAETAAATPPLIEVTAQAPTVIDVPFTEIESATVTADGAIIEGGFITVDIPEGAVASDTSIVLTRLDAPFKRDASANAHPEAVEAVAIGPTYDLGPAGTSFLEPVTVTLRYDLGFGPQEIDPDRIAVAYWDGEAWMATGGTVDLERRTVSVRLQEVQGSILGACVVGGVVGTGIVVAVRWWMGSEWVTSDPVSEGRAGDFITPNDPIVRDQADRAVLQNKGTNETKALDDPDLAAWIAEANAKGQTCRLAFTGTDGVVGMRYTVSEGSNWQTPAQSFTKGTPLRGPLSGDCTDTTNVAVSVFRARGFAAKAIYGHTIGDPGQGHVWGEVVIGDALYLIGDEGDLFTGKNTGKLLDHFEYKTDPSDSRYNSMYDENGQRPYDPNWWKDRGHWQLIDTRTNSEPYAQAFTDPGSPITWADEDKKLFRSFDTNIRVTVAANSLEMHYETIDCYYADKPPYPSNPNSYAKKCEWTPFPERIVPRETYTITVRAYVTADGGTNAINSKVANFSIQDLLGDVTGASGAGEGVSVTAPVLAKGEQAAGKETVEVLRISLGVPQDPSAMGVFRARVSSGASPGAWGEILYIYKWIEPAGAAGAEGAGGNW